MNLNELVTTLQRINPDLLLKADDTFFWSPAEKTVHYDKDGEREQGLWSLLHETGHALLEHTQYYSDVELVRMEVSAWEEAKSIGAEIGIHM
jgi:Zn-dependent peptidase ImmA (M78 family)